MALMLKIDQIEFCKTKAIVQAVVGADEAQKALDAYREVRMPYLEKVKERDKEKHVKMLMNEILKGPLAISPIFTEKKVKSRMKTLVAEKMTPDQRAALNRLSNKFGRVL